MSPRFIWCLRTSYTSLAINPRLHSYIPNGDAKSYSLLGFFSHCFFLIAVPKRPNYINCAIFAWRFNIANSPSGPEKPVRHDLDWQLNSRAYIWMALRYKTPSPDITHLAPPQSIVTKWHCFRWFPGNNFPSPPPSVGCRSSLEWKSTRSNGINH